MAKFLFTCWPFSGHLHPAISIACALRDRNHEVAFYTGGSARETLASEGFTHFPFKHVDEQKVVAIVSTEFTYSASFSERFKRANRRAEKFREWLIDSIPQQVSDLEEVISEWEPDYLVCDFTLLGPYVILRETRKCTVAILSVSIGCCIPGREVPHWGPGWPPPKNWATRLLHKSTRAVGTLLCSEMRTKLNEVREVYGLAPLRSTIVDLASTMPIYLMPSLREFDYSRQDLPPSVRYVGPCLWDKPNQLLPPRWLDDLPPEIPLVYVTEATIGANEPVLLKTALRACAELPVHVIMTTGKQRSVHELNLGEIPLNVHVESYVPQSDLMSRASVVVTVGGSGGVLAALKAGVPLVVVPTEWDRQENAQRIVQAGAGIRIDVDKCTAGSLRAAILRVLGEPCFRENARRLAAACAQYGGPLEAASLLESLNAAEEIAEI